MNKRGLGRGLGALIPETVGRSHTEGDAILTLMVDLIEPNPLQPRKAFAEEEIARLAESILELVRNPARGIAMGEAGRREVIEHWNLAERATELVDVYRRALADQ